MSTISIDSIRERRAFALWLRTGQRPSVSDAGIELKFNPWHDPDDGKFTNAGAGRYFGPGGGRSAGRGARRDRKASPESARKTPSRGPADKVVEFAGGVQEGVTDVAKETADGLYKVSTTHPGTTVRNFGKGLARTIDAAIAAEDTPARVQVRRATHGVANASTHDVGYAFGRIGANAVITEVPGAAVAKVSTVRRLAASRPRETFHPPETTWRTEIISEEGPAKTYNDSAKGARPGQAPALMRTMPDGSKRPVKFDGVDGDYLIDRKWSIRRNQKAKDQALRQKMRGEAIRFLKILNIKNIKTRVVKP